MLYLTERSPIGAYVGDVIGASVVPTDVISVQLLGTANSALGTSPALAFNSTTSRVTTLVGNLGLSYAAGLRNITLNFRLTNPGVNPAGASGFRHGLAACPPWFGA